MIRTNLRCGLVLLAISSAGIFPSVSRAQLAKPATQPAAVQTEVPVKVVVLYSSGVGYFEHGGSIKGDGFTEIRFKTNQINDILKSLVLEDLGDGKVSAVVYPSQDPISKTLKSFQVDITANPSFGELLNQLRGATVKLNFGAQVIEGTILGLEKKPKAVGDKGQIEVWVLNLISGADIRAIPLDEVSMLELQDAQLKEELHKALVALTQARDQDKKPVRISFTGQGERNVRLGYVVETPVWKSSYRLILPAAAQKDAKPQIQGWAIVENQTDNDWNNVQLSLVSGRPISFIEELYQPLYIPRPVVQPKLYASLKPQTYDEGMATADKKRMEAAGESDGDMAKQDQANGAAAGSFRRAGKAAAAAAPPAAPMAQEQMEKGERALDATRSIASVASASKIGELFQYTVGNVSLPRQRSSMIPIVADTIEVEKLSIYNAAVLPRNPLNGARMKNTTGKHLLQGPITVLEGSSYAGDAQIDNVPPGQERLLSYGVDLQMLVDATKNNQTSAITTGSIVKGVLNLTYKYESNQDYVAENKSDNDKTLIVEHPRKPQWTLITPDKPLESTDAVYRFRLPVPKGEKKTLNVKEEMVQRQTLAIIGYDSAQLDVYSRTDRIPKSVRDALVEAMKRKGALVETQRQLETVRRQKQELTVDQGRTRDNMKTLAQNNADPSYIRFKKKLDTQEDQMEKLDEQIDALTKKFQAQQKELEDYLNSLNIEEGK